MPYIRSNQGQPHSSKTSPHSASIISRLPLSSLTTKEFKWLHIEAWNDEEFSYFTEQRPHVAVGLATPPPSQTQGRHEAAYVAGRWVLVTDQGCRAWFELQGFPGKFQIFHALLGPHADQGSWSPASLRRLSLMVSGSLIMSGADVLLLMSVDSPTSQTLKELGWGETHQVFSPFSCEHLLMQRKAQSGIYRPVVRIDPHEWWETENGKLDRETLSYLQKRVDSLKEKPTSSSVRRRGFLSRFLTWR